MPVVTQMIYNLSILELVLTTLTNNLHLFITHGLIYITTFMINYILYT